MFRRYTFQHSKKPGAKASGLATVHPSSVLRAPDDETRRAEMARLVEDLKKVARVL